MNIGFKEDITHEFKSDTKKISDETIIEAVVAFANTEGGTLYIGVEDDGSVTGLHESHKDTVGLAAVIANKTIPAVSVRIHMEKHGKQVIVIEVPQSRSIVSTISGKMVRRRLKADGTPENIPMYPYEIVHRLSSLSLLDFSAQPVPEATTDDFDPLERHRLRRIISEYNGEQNLLSLDDDELNRALTLTVTINDVQYPTLTGMLLIGKKERLKALVPTAEASVQILKGTDIVINESFTEPVLSTFEKIYDYVDARNDSREIDIGLYNMAVFDIDKRAFREALVNAFAHRDYSLLGRVRVLLDDSGLTISNPGGFIEGVNVNNLINAEPHGRNPVLADALKRLGLAERTGRGIDRIYEGSLLFGKLMPDYSLSNERTVSLFIPKSKPDVTFTEMILREQKRVGHSLSIQTLLVLNCLKRLGKVSVDEIAEWVDGNDAAVTAELENLVENGIVEYTGDGRYRKYMLSPKVYKRENTAGSKRSESEKNRFEEIILKEIAAQGFITRKTASELLDLTLPQAYRVLNRMLKEGKIKMRGRGRNAGYVINRAEEM